jgi:hypothetical protein
MGFLALYAIFPGAILYLTLLATIISRYKKGLLKSLSLGTAIAAIISIVLLIGLWNYAGSTKFFIEKNTGREKVFVQGIEAGQNLKYFYEPFDLTFTYPKDWNLVIEERDMEKINQYDRRIAETILITPRGRDTINWGGEELSGITISVLAIDAGHNHDPATIIKEKQISWIYLGDEIFNGRSYPYYKSRGGAFSFDKGTMTTIYYTFANDDHVFLVSYSISEEEAGFEPILLEIIKSIEFNSEKGTATKAVSSPSNIPVDTWTKFPIMTVGDATDYAKNNTDMKSFILEHTSNGNTLGYIGGPIDTDGNISWDTQGQKGSLWEISAYISGQPDIRYTIRFTPEGSVIP